MQIEIQVKNEKFESVTVQETIDLLNNDFETVCDDSHARFTNRAELPPYYDEEKFKRGQQFYHKHIQAMFIGKLCGLLTVISTPTVLNVLVFTEMSSEPLTAYKRYLATVFHMCVWYDRDFKPSSKLWQSINTVKSLHNSASKRHCTATGQRIFQKDMGITQFGFMGFAVVRPELIGIFNAKKEELESFIHLWRVIGYIIGMDDKYNICKDSLEETREICEGLIKNIFIENIKTTNRNYWMLFEALINGMWCMQPFLEVQVFKTFLHTLLSNNKHEFPRVPLNWIQRLHFFLLQHYIYCQKFFLTRKIGNFLQYLSFWLMRNFPFLAFYSFGYENSFVSIFKGRRQKRG